MLQKKLSFSLTLLCALSPSSSFQLSNANQEVLNIIRSARLALQQSPKVAATSYAAGLLLGAAIGSADYDTWFTADDVPGYVIRTHRPFAAEVVKVSDGDTFRIRHLPTPFSSSDFSESLSQSTIKVRAIAYDAPETAKFGQPGQPNAEDAKRYAQDLLEGKRVRVSCFARDRYGRLLCSIGYRKIVFNHDLSEDMVLAGFGAIYRGQDAIYGVHELSWWNALEQRAQSRKVGMWMESDETTQLPSEYKRAQRNRKSS